MYSTSAIQLRFHRARRAPLSSLSKSVDSRRMSERSMSSKALTLTTPYSLSSIREVTTGTTPQRAQVWNDALCVPNAYLDTNAGSCTTIRKAPRGLEVHKPPCLEQNVQEQARAGIWAGSGSHVREKEMFPQWHFPLINMRIAPNEDASRARRSQWLDGASARDTVPTTTQRPKIRRRQ
jgi:hypothetical protein